MNTGVMVTTRGVALIAMTLLALASCSSGTSSVTSTSAANSTESTADQKGEASSTGSGCAAEKEGSNSEGTAASRPFEVEVPASYSEGSPAPLLILLHGYGADGASLGEALGIKSQAERLGILLVHPDGTAGVGCDRFWNATGACCGFGRQVDDVGYLSSVIDDVSARYSVDPKRVFLIGHSNGGFMSYRLACERADRIAAIVSVAGETLVNAADCTPSVPVSVLQVQGTEDATILYGGGKVQWASEAYPGARQSVAMWAGYDHCTGTISTEKARDLQPQVAGAETVPEEFSDCPTGIAVQLWTMSGVGHWPWAIRAGTGEPDLLVAAMLEFLMAHPKL